MSDADKTVNYNLSKDRRVCRDVMIMMTMSIDAQHIRDNAVGIKNGKCDKDMALDFNYVQRWIRSSAETMGGTTGL